MYCSVYVYYVYYVALLIIITCCMLHCIFIDIINIIRLWDIILEFCNSAVLNPNLETDTGLGIPAGVLEEF